MAGFLRPRRGRRSTAESQAIILKRGEVFFECPDTGVGTGTGKIKVGDGTTAYADLPYFMDLSSVTTDVAGSAIAFTESTTTDNATLLASIKSGATLKTMISAMKKLLSNLDTSVTQLNNDLESYATTSEVSTIVNSAIESGEIKVSSSPFKSIKQYTMEGNTTGITVTGSGFVNVLYRKPSSWEDFKTYIVLDNVSVSYEPENGNIFFFEKSAKIYTATNGHIIFVISLFN